jgi:hypothetical protein
MVEFYQLNKGCLNSKLTHYIVKGEAFSRLESEVSVASSATSEPSSLEQAKVGRDEEAVEMVKETDEMPPASSNGHIINNNNVVSSKDTGSSSVSSGEDIDAVMTSEGDLDSLLRECNNSKG